jgi:hypothetical protein
MLDTLVCVRDEAGKKEQSDLAFWGSVTKQATVANYSRWGLKAGRTCNAAAQHKLTHAQVA